MFPSIDVNYIYAHILEYCITDLNIEYRIMQRSIQ